jgi:hypothetical protein
MLSRNREDTTRAEQPGGIIPAVHSILAVFVSKEPRPSRCWRRGINISGVDFWHAVEFSRNGRFLRTHPHGLSSGRFPSVLRFRLYQTLFRSDFLGAFQVSAFAFPFPAIPTLSELSSRTDRPYISDSSRGASSGTCVSEGSGKLTDTHRCRPGETQFQATVRIYLPTSAVSTAPVGRRRD